MALTISSILALFRTIVESSISFPRSHEVATTTKNLYVAIIISNYCAFCFGISVGWMNPAEHRVLRKNTYKFKPTIEQWDLICSLLPLGAVLWCLPMGALMKYQGCKSLLYLQVLPYTCAWLLFNFANSIYMLYVARFLQGICGAAVSLAVPVYLNEISPWKYRGWVGSLYYGAFLYGIIYSHVMAELFRLQTVHMVNLILAVPFIFIWIIPESPYHYANVHKVREARLALIQLRGKEHDVQDELNLMVNLATSAMDPTFDWWESFKYSVKLQTVIRSTALMIFHYVGGGVAVVIYMDNMLQKLAGDHYKNYLWGLFFFMTVGHLICVLLVDRIGRRPLMAVTTMILVCCSLYLCCWFRGSLVNEDHMLTKLIMYLFAMVYSMGLGPLASLLNVELILPPYRAYGCAFANLWSWLFVFIMVQWIPFRQYECMIFDGLLVILLLTLIFVLVFLPETNGMSPLDIQKVIDSINGTASGDES